MSHQIVKSLSIRNGKVAGCSASNNIRPLDYSKWKSNNHYSELLETAGREYAITTILFDYYQGSLKEGVSNQFSSAVNWYSFICEEHNTKMYPLITVAGELDEKVMELETNWENMVKDGLYAHYKSYLKRAKGKFVIMHSNRMQYVMRFRYPNARLHTNIDKAKVFTSLEDAQGYLYKNNLTQLDLSIKEV